ncbi:MutS domain V [Fervidobacterium changbaicum]|uniref:DNA mismatch repair protein MutS n=1 Tax=Fervidobacterium changbaicum TaxID=310769 RepID=A0ABX5QPC7_9BACT|nr:hypothetical protein [Fervidobacterium changbaicum]QAV32282.1 DNA mismatch repair protein MutS [Fervidobacterium changbaicum]QAV34046.1 DNA mismatch repair protein MutS [Fervidobacterium changbaicum]SDH38388.1 MutS domain V [Fervidobacterium changbaicum]
MTLTTTLPKREEFERLTGFEYIKNKIEPKTPMGKRYFKYLQPLNYEHILEHLNDTEFFLHLLTNYPKVVEELEHDLECIVDVSKTIERISNGETLDEIELFELKNFVLVAQEIKNKNENLISGHERFTLPDLTEIIDLLDPEKLRLPTFYIYDAYDDRLRDIRKKKRELLQNVDAENTESYIIELTQQEKAIEDEVLEKISEKLHDRAQILHESITRIKYIDIILAKAKLSKEIGLTKPNLHPKEYPVDEIRIMGMFNPQLKDELERRGKKYQPVDITIKRGVTVIVGANMSGKSVILRTVALIQYMASLGFFVPSQHAELPFVEVIALITEDFQRPLSGLSSFASEITLINEAYKHALNNNALVLIDEPARTTNPYEGTAIVNALVKCFEKTEKFVLIVTHFDDVECPMRFRVKGLRENALKSVQSFNDIQDLMDYELVPDDGSSVPKEAIKVMELLGVNEEIILQAKKILESRK